MDRKAIQEKRMRGYFIEATREILKGEGLKSVNVRAIAERAGYSYATLYNYFRDVKELIFICVQDFEEEAKLMIRDKTKKTPGGIRKIKEIIKAYTGYFIQYPGIFELFFLENMSTISGNQPTAELIYTFLDQLTAEEWKYCIEQKIYSVEQAEIRNKALKYSVTGLMLYYLNRMHPESYEQFIDAVEKQIAFILNEG